MNFETAYLKLTLFYVLVVMIISIGFSVAFYRISSNEINRGLGNQVKFIRGLQQFNLDKAFTNFEEIKIQQLIESNTNLRNNLINFNLLIFAFSTIFSYILAKRTLDPIEMSVEKQKRFTADASHELRTPLTAIQSEIEVNLRDKNLTLTAAKKILQSNLEEIQKIEALSSALLKLARFDSNVIQKYELISLKDILCEAFQKIEKKADKKSIKFKNKLADIKIRGDYQSLLQLMVILLDNAIKYSPNKSTVTINIDNIHHSKVLDSKILSNTIRHYAVIKIKDQGCGISEKDIPFIFDRFYRADPSRCKIKSDGYGLGLSIAKEIVLMHNGKISVVSKNNKGSEFIVNLPLAKL